MAADMQDIGNKNTQQDRNDFRHPLAPHVEADDDNDCHNSNQPAGFTVRYGRGRKRKADRDDNGSCNNRGKEAHKALKKAARMTYIRPAIATPKQA